MQIQFYVDGELQLSRKLRGIAANSRDWTPALQESIENLKDTFSGPVFDTEGGEIDAQWAPLSEAYAKQKERKYPGMPILQATGLMRASFLSQFDSTSATIWNTAEYFKYHQSNLPRTKLPRRVMMKLTENLKHTVTNTFQQLLLTNLTS